MPVATTQTAITATGSTGVVRAADPTRRMLFIKCYVNNPTNQVAQTGAIYVAFGKAATVGTAGELELIPGSEYVFGGPLPPRVANLPHGMILPNCPTESINVISSSGTVYGAILEQ